MVDGALPHPPQVVVGIGAPQDVGLLDGHARRHVAVQWVVGTRLVGDDIDLNASPDQLRQHLGGVAREADRQAATVPTGSVKPSQSVVEVGGPLVQVAGLDPPLDPVQVDLDAQRRATQHRDRQRLRAAHAAEPRRNHQPTLERPVEALAGGRRKRLVGALQDPLAPDVDPGAGGHLPVHHQSGGVELTELLPGRPLGNQVGVGDQHPWRVGVGLEDRHRLAGLNEQRFGVGEPLQLALNRVIAGPVARRLADAAVDDQLLGTLGYVRMQVVVQHPQRAFLLPATAEHQFVAP